MTYIIICLVCGFGAKVTGLKDSLSDSRYQWRKRTVLICCSRIYLVLLLPQVDPCGVISWEEGRADPFTANTPPYRMKRIYVSLASRILPPPWVSQQLDAVALSVLCRPAVIHPTWNTIRVSI